MIWVPAAVVLGAAALVSPTSAEVVTPVAAAAELFVPTSSAVSDVMRTVLARDPTGVPGVMVATIGITTLAPLAMVADVQVTNWPLTEQVVPAGGLDDT